MTSLLESLIAVIAPHCCISCSNYNNIVCDICLPSLAPFASPACVVCDRSTRQTMLCKTCYKQTALSAVWVRAEYGGQLAELIKCFKFKRVAVAAKPLARLLAETLPALAPETVIVPVPTAHNRIRQRGYDHTFLLAKEISVITGHPVQCTLGRATNTRQVGANKQQRFNQATKAFEVKGKPASSILLVDDVLTTGASLRASAQLLAQAGASDIKAVVLARQLAASQQGPEMIK